MMNYREQVIGCAFEVSNTLGAGFFEKVYEKAMCIELKKAGLGYVCQQPVSVKYKDSFVGEYIADIVVEGQLLLELKALSAFVP